MAEKAEKTTPPSETAQNDEAAYLVQLLTTRYPYTVPPNTTPPSRSRYEAPKYAPSRAPYHGEGPLFLGETSEPVTHHLLTSQDRRLDITAFRTGLFKLESGQRVDLLGTNVLVYKIVYPGNDLDRITVTPGGEAELPIAELTCSVDIYDEGPTIVTAPDIGALYNDIELAREIDMER